MEARPEGVIHHCHKSYKRHLRIVLGQCKIWEEVENSLDES